MRNNSVTVKLTNDDIFLANAELDGNPDPGVIHVPSEDWNYLITNNENDYNYATDLYLNVKDVHVVNNVQREGIRFDKISFLSHSDRYIDLHFDIDSFSEEDRTYQIVGFPFQFTLAPKQDAIVVIYQYRFYSVHMSIMMFSSNNEQYRTIKIRNSEGSFTNPILDGNEVYVYVQYKPHNPNLDSYPDGMSILSVFKHFDEEWLATFMYDVTLYKLPREEGGAEPDPDKVYEFFTDKLIYFDLGYFDFNNLSMPGYPENQEINSLINM